MEDKSAPIPSLPSLGGRVRIRRNCSDWPRAGTVIGAQFEEWTPVLWDLCRRPDYVLTMTIEGERGVPGAAGE